MNLSLTENLRFEPEEGSAPWLDGEPDWTPRMLRSALVWLALRLGKSILKLTDKDYRENGLESLLKRFGSCLSLSISDETSINASFNLIRLNFMSP